MALGARLAAQEVAPAPTADRRPPTTTGPTVAVVLSGGSAKAFAHIGVLEVLEQVGMPVDVVTGASMGGIVGGLYAIGYTPAMLERVALTTDWDGVFQGAARRDQLRPAQKLGDGRWVATFPIRGGRVRLPAGLVPRQRVSDVLARLTWSVPDARDFRAFPIPFAAVATDLETGESVRLDHGVLSDALQASMALPGVFAPMELDGRTYVDGGVARNLPAQDAREMGATVVVCVDVSDPLLPADSLKDAADVLLQTISFQMQRSNEAQRKLCDVVIAPDITGLPATSFTRGAVWIARGRAAANAMKPRLQALADSVRALRAGLGARDSGIAIRPGQPLDASRGTRAPSPESRAPSYAAAGTPHTTNPAPWDSVYVRQIRVRGHGDARHRLADRLAGTTLSVRTPGWVTPARLEDALARLYGSGHFERVTYAIEPGGPEGAAIVVDVTPRNEDAVGLGLRYDSQRQAALLFSAVVHDRLHYGSTAQLDVRLGEQLQFDARYVFDETPTTHAERRFRATYLRTPLRLYDGDRGVAEEQLHVADVSASVGHTLSTSAALSMEVKGEYARNQVVTAPVAMIERGQAYYTLAAQLWLDSFDRTVFPTRGGGLIAQSEVADRHLGSNATFSRHVVDGQRYLPLGRRTSLVGRVALGWTTGPADLPQHDRFYLGGSVPSAVLGTQFLPFDGLKEQQLTGRGVRLASLGAQRELQRNVFATARWNVGTTFDAWPSLREHLRYQSGVALSLGALSPAGPVSATLASKSGEWAPRLDVEFGFRF